MQDYTSLIKKIITIDKALLNADFLVDCKREFAKQNHMTDMPSNISLLRTYHRLLNSKKIKKNIQIENLLKLKSVRSSSWIVAIQVLTKPFPCPGKCIFCPNDPSMPKSYIKSEPGAMRALLNHFNPLKQVYNRLTSLTLTGHQTDKIEMIVLWWTRDCYPRNYKINFIKWLYDAVNSFSKLRIMNYELWINGKDSDNKFKYKLKWLDKIKYPKTIGESIRLNEKAKNRIIWLTIETRPEFVTDKNCKIWRDLWVTRIEIWLQSTDDKILNLNQRWHSLQQFRDAIHKLRQYAFKFTVHIMPGLYGSTYAKDLSTFQTIYSDPFIKPDEIKFYPTSVIPNTKLFKLYKQWKYKPLTTQIIKKLIVQTFLTIIPPYTRIKRLIRDIPANEIVAWSKITNLSQLVHDKMKLEMINAPEASRAGKWKMKKFYSRLYWNYKLFKNINSFLNSKFQNIVRNGRDRSLQNNIQTFIVWSKPDLISFRDFVSLDTRSREIRHRIWNEKLEIINDKLKIKNNRVNLVIRKYQSSVGSELFISFEDHLWYLFWFTRLLLPEDKNVVNYQWLGKNIAMIRELHIYWQVESLKHSALSIKLLAFQHKWFGRQLMEIAENISVSSWYSRLSVISWIGVREYYKKLWYKLDGTYMVKKLVNSL